MNFATLIHLTVVAIGVYLYMQYRNVDNDYDYFNEFIDKHITEAKTRLIEEGYIDTLINECRAIIRELRNRKI